MQVVCALLPCCELGTIYLQIVLQASQQKACKRLVSDSGKRAMGCCIACLARVIVAPCCCTLSACFELRASCCVVPSYHQFLLLFCVLFDHVHVGWPFAGDYARV